MSPRMGNGIGEPRHLQQGKSKRDCQSNSLCSSRRRSPTSCKTRSFRAACPIVEPGGIVAWHSHADRPAIIYIIEGEINEYASNCAVPITHKAGDVVAEIEISHWWKNLGDKTVVLLSADLLWVGGAAAVEEEAIGCC